MKKKKERKNLNNSSLSKTIRQETISYIKKMNGMKVNDLHSLFIVETETALISTVLNHLKGNVTKTADYLGMNRGTLIKRIKDYNI
tara:strand:+ start:1014 stop:1271 length:258 start_codon:yes stop_codon:yes gene_type:complete